MLVKEMIEKLGTMPPDHEIIIFDEEEEWVQGFDTVETMDFPSLHNLVVIKLDMRRGEDEVLDITELSAEPDDYDASCCDETMCCGGKCDGSCY